MTVAGLLRPCVAIRLGCTSRRGARNFYSVDHRGAGRRWHRRHTAEQPVEGNDRRSSPTRNTEGHRLSTWRLSKAAAPAPDHFVAPASPGMRRASKRVKNQSRCASCRARAACRVRAAHTPHVHVHVCRTRPRSLSFTGLSRDRPTIGLPERPHVLRVTRVHVALRPTHPNQHFPDQRAVSATAAG